MIVNIHKYRFTHDALHTNSTYASTVLVHNRSLFWSVLSTKKLLELVSCGERGLQFFSLQEPKFFR